MKTITLLTLALASSLHLFAVSQDQQPIIFRTSAPAAAAAASSTQPNFTPPPPPSYPQGYSQQPAGQSQMQQIAVPRNGAVLEAFIDVAPAQPTPDNQKMIQPGSTVLVSVKIRNIGNEKNKPGKFKVHFTYPGPIGTQESSILWSSEEIPLPPITPGKEAMITFSTPQQTPSLMDFIRLDYGARLYQAVVTIDNQGYIIGTSSLTYTCYYYPGAVQENPTVLPASK